jgi:hypothetical protein
MSLLTWSCRCAQASHRLGSARKSPFSQLLEPRIGALSLVRTKDLRPSWDTLVERSDPSIWNLPGGARR